MEDGVIRLETLCGASGPTSLAPMRVLCGVLELETVVGRGWTRTTYLRVISTEHGPVEPAVTGQASLLHPTAPYAFRKPLYFALGELRRR